jgi:hypothetical protein
VTRPLTAGTKCNDLTSLTVSRPHSPFVSAYPSFPCDKRQICHERSRSPTATDSREAPSGLDDKSRVTMPVLLRGHAGYYSVSSTMEIPFQSQARCWVSQLESIKSPDQTSWSYMAEFSWPLDESNSMLPDLATDEQAALVCRISQH